MLIYLTAFAMHISFLFLSARMPSKRVGLMLALIALIPLCVIAGARDVSVGTDTAAYPLRCFDASRLGSPVGALNACSDQEPLFVLLFWLLGRVTGDFNAVLLFCEAIVLAPYVLVARKLFPRGYPMFGFFLCFIVFGYSLNIIRQCLATSMLVLMVYELIRGKRLPAFIFLTVAVGFHKMAIVGLLIWAAYAACSERYRGRSSKTVAALVCFGAVDAALCAIMVGPSLMELISALTTSYSFQVQHAGMGSFNTTMLLYLPFCLVVWMLGRMMLEGSESRQLLNFFLICGITASVFAQFASVSPELIRLSFPFLFISGFLFPLLAEGLGKERLLTGCLAAGFCFLYFFITFVVGGSCALFPYSSSILGVVYA